MAEIAANLKLVKDRVAAAAERSGRRPGEVELVVVTKKWPVEVIREVQQAGHDLFGENKLQEALEKLSRLPGARWHFIGRLQRNKVRKVVPEFEAVHSVDSLRLAEAVDRVAGELGLRPRVYLQVNLAGETTKGGFSADGLRGEIERILRLAHLEVAGFMCMPPPLPAAEEVRPWFRDLRLLRDELRDRTGRPFSGLSMGMSHDFEVAIEEGATIVRIGSAIFGPRPTG